MRRSLVDVEVDVERIHWQVTRQTSLNATSGPPSGESPSPTVTNFKRGAPHHPLRLSAVWGGRASRPPSSEAAPHRPLRPSVGRGGIPHCPLHPRWPLAITSGPSPGRPTSPPRGGGTSPSPRWGPRDPSPSPSSEVALRPLGPSPPRPGWFSAPSGPSPAPSPQAAGLSLSLRNGPSPAGPRRRRRLPALPPPPRPRPGPAPASAALTAAGAVGPGRRGAGRRRPRRRRSCRGSAGRSPLRRRRWQLPGPPEAEAAARPRRPVAAAGEQR